MGQRGREALYPSGQEATKRPLPSVVVRTHPLPAVLLRSPPTDDQALTTTRRRPHTNHHSSSFSAGGASNGGTLPKRPVGYEAAVAVRHGKKSSSTIQRPTPIADLSPTIAPIVHRPSSLTHLPSPILPHSPPIAHRPSPHRSIASSIHRPIDPSLILLCLPLILRRSPPTDHPSSLTTHPPALISRRPPPITHCPTLTLVSPG